jgi:hypothetical protein
MFVEGALAGGNKPAEAAAKTSQSDRSAANRGDDHGDIPPNSSFTPPAANECQSKYDQFYEGEHGVYAYWPLCEHGSPMQIYDYVGPFDLIKGKSFGAGVVVGGAPGPVPDDETAANIPTANVRIQGQGIPLNTKQGTVSAWINADATSFPVTAVFFGAVSASSAITVGLSAKTEGICFQGTFKNATGKASLIEKCGYAANKWHRVHLSWAAGSLTLFVDGVSAATGTYSGALDNSVFYYRLFPGCCNTGKQMTLAKVSIANKAWSQSQVSADFTPLLPEVPVGGVYISKQVLGTIHKDVLGYADLNQYLSPPALKNALIKGLTTEGVTALRYDGARGLRADQENWQGIDGCTSIPGVKTQPSAQNLATGNTLDTYLSGVATPLGLDVMYTVNYGTNSATCVGGGDPIVNGANLVRYANRTKDYGIKYWEIGNELFSNTTETDFHPNPNTGASYAEYEPEFYKAMKAVDPTIKIGVPVGMTTYHWQSGFDLPVLSGARYDAAIWHNYPMKDPVTDGSTLYQDRVHSNMVRTRGILRELQTELLSNGKDADDIWITEWSGSVLGDKWTRQTIGAVEPLFAVMQLAEYMDAGVKVANFWGQGMTDVCSTLNWDNSGESAYSWWECGNSGLVYTGPKSGLREVATGMKPGDIYPVGRAFQVLSQSGFVTEGEHMLRTQNDVTNAPWLESYAATHGSSYAVILINRDRDSEHTVPIEFAQTPAGSSAKQWTYGRKQYDSSRAGDWSVGPEVSSHGPWKKTFRAKLPPWSVSVIVFGQ